MFEFPPESWLATGWRPHVVYVTILVVGTAFINLVCRFAKEPKRRHVVLVMLILSIQSYCLNLQLGSITLTLVAPGLYFWFVWLFSFWKIIGILALLGDRRGGLQVFESVVIVLTLCWLSLPSLMFVAQIAVPREASRRSQCRNNLKQIGLALHNYHDIYERFPAQQFGNPPRSWRVEILPLLDSAPLYSSYKLEKEWNIGSNRDIAHTEINYYQCPSNPSKMVSDEFPTTAYVGIVGPKTILQPEQSLAIAEVTDGISNTLLVAEACGLQIPWSKPEDAQLSETELVINAPGKEPGRSEGAMSSFHYGGVQVLIADGSVRYVGKETDKKILKALITASGGEENHEF